PNTASGSLFIANSCWDTREGNAMTQSYGYNEPASGLQGIQQFGNNYERNKLGATHSGPTGGRLRVFQVRANETAGAPISAEVKAKLVALANSSDTGMSDATRRILREYLSR